MVELQQQLANVLAMKTKMELSSKRTESRFHFVGHDRDQLHVASYKSVAYTGSQPKLKEQNPQLALSL